MLTVLRKKDGFSFIEVIVVLIVLGILIAVAIPKFISLQDVAINAATVSIIAHVNTGIRLYYLFSDFKDFPDKLDNAGVGDSPIEKPFFEIVLVNGITDDKWQKIVNIKTYQAPNDSIYVYFPTQGYIK